jgi:hypothetical protein
LSAPAQFPHHNCSAHTHTSAAGAAAHTRARLALFEREQALEDKSTGLARLRKAWDLVNVKADLVGRGAEEDSAGD